MISRFDLPPEVMPGERLPRPGEVKAKPVVGERWLPHPENRHIEVNERGQMRTCGPTPPAKMEDLVMLTKDARGPENEEDDPVDDSEANAFAGNKDFIAGIGSYLNAQIRPERIAALDRLKAQFQQGIRVPRPAFRGELVGTVVTPFADGATAPTLSELTQAFLGIACSTRR